MLKQVLIITYYWPPAGGPGVQRWLKFVKYLSDFNIKPIVYIPENPHYPILDINLLEDVPNHITILKQPIKEPYNLAKLLSTKRINNISKGIIPEEKKQNIFDKLLLFIRGNFFIPDARKAWIKPSVLYLSQYIIKNNIETIITTGPPHSMHLIGLALKEKLKLKWIADFRDPWTTIAYHKQLRLTKKSRKKHIVLEHKVINTADDIIVTSNNTKNEFEVKTKKTIHVITNGYDTTPVAKVILDDTFSISHIGSLLTKRNPRILWKVLRELCNEVEGFSKDLRLNFIGLISEDIIEILYQYELKPYINILNYVNHDEAIKHQQRSQVLLLIEIDSEDTKAIIPGKLFEYLSAKRPIIAIGPKDTDVETIIKTTNSGYYHYYNNETKLKSNILMYYNDFKKGKLNSKTKGIEKYSRKNLTKVLSKLI